MVHDAKAETKPKGPGAKAAPRQRRGPKDPLKHNQRPATITYVNDMQRMQPKNLRMQAEELYV